MTPSCTRRRTWRPPSPSCAAGSRHSTARGRSRLLTAFEQVNVNFAKLFTHLFGGGEARLVLVESDDPLEAGLEILCQPPGKKLSTLSLLSGGEQTLTALALIFAVFLANPAPICVLDEVDAPLDDANVGRFLRPAGRDDAPDRDAVPDHHAPCRDDGAHGSPVRGDDGRTGRVATGERGPQRRPRRWLPEPVVTRS